MESVHHLVAVIIAFRTVALIVNIVYGLIFRGPFFEVGNRADYIKSKFKMAFCRNDLTDLRPEIYSFLEERIKNPLLDQVE